ncbi:hypothetical protein FRB91_010088 [Serendipita sp. 411]|nr:hypothetical protein FRB91_010088 [Serendipita sp. 411]
MMITLDVVFMIRSSLTHSASAPITRATMTINDPGLQRIHEELEAIQKSLGEQLDQLKPIRNDAKLLEELAANINTYDNHVARNSATLNRPGASSTQSSASPSSSREPNHEAPSSKSSSLVGIVASFGQSVDPPAATMSPPATNLNMFDLGSSLSRSSLAPITGAMKSPKEQKLQSLRMELEALRKTMREELDRLKIIQHEMRLPEQLRANINAYEDQVARLEKEKKEAKQRFQSSSSQYGDPRMLRLLRTEHEQNQKRIEYQIHQWDKLSKEATTNLESLKQYHPSMKAEANALRVSLTGHETMRAFLVEMITDIEGEYLPQETSDEMIRRVELGLSERTSREPRSPEVKSTLARGFPTIDHSSEA